eukprot:362037-Prymnesium_polylepis.1
MHQASCHERLAWPWPCDSAPHTLSSSPVTLPADVAAYSVHATRLRTAVDLDAQMRPCFLLFYVDFYGGYFTDDRLYRLRHGTRGQVVCVRAVCLGCGRSRYVDTVADARRRSR